eukprot:1612877-Prymnesium_polylepis.1
MRLLEWFECRRPRHRRGRGVAVPDRTTGRRPAWLPPPQGAPGERPGPGPRRIRPPQLASNASTSRVASASCSSCPSRIHQRAAPTVSATALESPGARSTPSLPSEPAKSRAGAGQAPVAWPTTTATMVPICPSSGRHGDQRWCHPVASTTPTPCCVGRHQPYRGRPSSVRHRFPTLPPTACAVRGHRHCRPRPIHLGRPRAAREQKKRRARARMAPCGSSGRQY